MRDVVFAALVLTAIGSAGALAQGSSGPDTVIVQSGQLALRGFLWRPGGPGPYPAVLFNHGSYSTTDPLSPTDPASLGSAFVRNGYVFLFLCRRGVGLSANQGSSDGDLLTQALAAHGQGGRNAVQLELLQTEDLDEALAGLAYLRARPDVDAHRLAAVGHSFGGSLTVLLAARDTSLRAAVVFAGAALSWQQSPELRARLLEAVGETSTPIFFIHAANDYSTTPGQVLADQMARFGRPHRFKVYPAKGQTVQEGHNFVFREVLSWEPDVFAFLAQRLHH
jgi:dienelactone hydrolase